MSPDFHREFLGICPKIKGLGEGGNTLILSSLAAKFIIPSFTTHSTQRIVKLTFSYNINC